MRFRCILLACLLVFVSSLARAQSWPTRPIHIIVSSGAGGTADILARVIGERLAAVLGVPVIIEDRPGAAGHLGAGSLPRAEADGYTVLMRRSPTHCVRPHPFQNPTSYPSRAVPP